MHLNTPEGFKERCIYKPYHVRHQKDVVHTKKEHQMEKFPHTWFLCSPREVFKPRVFSMEYELSTTRKYFYMLSEKENSDNQLHLCDMSVYANQNLWESMQ